jgi:DNA-binding MarR family transcriptional regulator
VSADATRGEDVPASDARHERVVGEAPDACEAALTELSPAELGAWRGMLRVHAALAKVLDAELETAHGLPLTSYEVLITLAAAPGRRLRMAELADRVLLSRSGMTRLCDRLEREGFLERTTCDSDGRGLFAVLTDAGVELVARARPVHLDGVRERFLRHFEEDELRVLAGWWERVLPGAAEAGRPIDLSPDD